MGSDFGQMIGIAPQMREIDRICGLPRTLIQGDNVPQEIVDYWSNVTRVPGSTAMLRPIQALALHTLYHERGLLAPIGCGFGKTIIALLAHHALPDIPPERILLFVPGANRKSLVLEAQKQLADFRINTQIKVFSYEVLQQPDQGPTLLKENAPLAIIADEAHNLSNPDNDSARTNRLMLYMGQNPRTIFAAMSGTLFSKSIKDVAHHCDLALKARTPIPTTWTGLDTMAACCDVQQGGDIAEPWQWREMETLVRAFHPEAHRLPPLMQMPTKTRREVCREALYQRIRTTPGIVQTSRDEVGVSLYMQARAPHVPQGMQQTLDQVKRTFQMPDGEELDSPLELYNALTQLSMGFYYIWDWPGKPDVPWLMARSRYKKAARVCQDHHQHNGIDSPTLVRRTYEQAQVADGDIVTYALAKVEEREKEIAKARTERQKLCLEIGEQAFWSTYGRVDDDLPPSLDLQEVITDIYQKRERARALMSRPEWEEYEDAYLEWLPESEKEPPPTKPVWFTDWFIDHVCNVAEANGDIENAIVWYSHGAVLERLRETKAPMVFLRPGDPVPTKVPYFPVAMSLKSHGTGHNLQAWGRSLLLCPPASAEMMEQWIKRIHRPGQERDEVRCEIYAHTEVLANSLAKAKEYAKFVEQTNGSPQALLYGTWLDVDAS